jgi:hypothetical protein
MFKEGDKINKTHYPKFERLFDIKTYYEIEIPRKCRQGDQPDFFFFQKVGLTSINGYQSMMACLPSIGKYLKGKLTD